jgi:hypothetical protein
MNVPHRSRAAFIGHLATYYTRADVDSAVALVAADCTTVTLQRATPRQGNA